MIEETKIQKYIAVSGGVESTTMCLKYGKGAIGIVCDTGDEEDLMYERWDFIENSMKIIHDGDFQLIRIKPTVFHKGIECNSLEEYAIATGFYAGPNSRYCTRKFKIEPIDNFLRDKGGCELMIGLNADEEGQREGNWEALKNVTYTYPLVDDGLNRDDCIKELKIYGLEPNFPVYMSRGGCKKCFFRGRKHAKAKYFFDRKGFLEDMQFEKDFNKNNGKKKFYGINANFQAGYESIMIECEQEIAMFGLEAMKEMYKQVEEHKACGVFCHR